jgi:hypothetical protein
MTKEERTQLVADQQALGFENGAAIGKVIFKQ